MSNTARGIVESLVAKGIIPEEFTDVAVQELHRELSRRSRRISATLAKIASSRVLLSRLAETTVISL